MFWSAQDPFAAGFGSGFAKPINRPYHEGTYFRPPTATRRSHFDRENELLRQQLYQQEMDRRAANARAEQSRIREQHRRKTEIRAADRARRLQTRRLAVLRYTAAARVIQRWWRTRSAARRAAAAEVVVAALRRNCAVRHARQIAGSLARLRELEATIESLPEAGAEVLDRRARAGPGISHFENTLEKLILSADDIPTHGSPTARAIRKRLVKTANTRLQNFDKRVVALQAAKAEQAAEQEAIRNVTLADVHGDTTISGSGLDASTDSVSPIAEVVKAPKEHDNGEEEEEDVDLALESEGRSAIVAEAPLEPGLATKALQVRPHDIQLGTPGTLMSSSTTLGDNSDSEEGVDQSSPPSPVNDVDYDNAMVADLLGARELSNNTPERNVSPDSECSSSPESLSECSSNPESLSELSFVEVDPNITPSEIEDDGGESLRNMDLEANPAKQFMFNSVSEVEHAANAADNLRVLVEKFTADLAEIEWSRDTSPGVCKIARDIQAAVKGMLPAAKDGHSN